MNSTRRSFIQGSVAAGVLGATSALRAAGANKRIVVGQIGCGRRSETHLKGLNEFKDLADVAYVCDPDSKRVAAAAKRVPGAKVVTDCRKVLDDPAVDAILIATPDHWHTPLALLALQAGKHVYVEKPCGHNLHEGRLLLEASKKSNLVVQHGTQARSNKGFQQAMQMLRDGIIGEVISAKAWNVQKRSSIGHLKPSAPPPELDYDMWLGPAVKMPFQKNRYHYTWHWWFNYGCGGIGNDGIHHVDYARWGLGVDSLPTRVSALGGKYYFDDDQQFPDTQEVSFEFPGDGSFGSKRILTYEQRLWSVTYPFNVDSGAEFYGTEGEMFISSRGKFRVIGPRNRRLDKAPEGSLKYLFTDHLKNWFDCIHSGNTPNGSMEIAHRTAGLVHLGNIATRLGRSLEFDPQTEQVVDDAEANAMLTGPYREGGHWAIPQGA